MNCPKCKGLSEVKDSRPVDGGDRWRRRRLCINGCGKFTTLEVVVTGPGDETPWSVARTHDAATGWADKAKDLVRQLNDILEKV